MAQGDVMDRSLALHQEEQHQTLSVQKKNYPSSLYSTEIIHALFGASVGTCWGDFSCNYHRLQGRLYASSSAVLFYSHLFGFERRLCLLWKDVLQVESYRTTSIRITMTTSNNNCEEETSEDQEYIFKTLADREYVVNLLQKLQSASKRNEQFDGDSNGTNANIMSSTSNVANANTENIGIEKSESIETQTSLPTDSVRPRSKSLNYIEDIIPVQQDERVSDGSSVCSTSEELPQDVDLKEAWDELKTNSSEWKGIALESMTLSCDLDTFYDTYLSDNAPCSIASYKRDVVGDSDLKTSFWQKDGDTHTRTITFQHPISSNFGSMVPSSAFTTKSQRLRRFGDFGMCMETSTEVAGVPYSDCFRVEDQWLIEPCNEDVDKVEFTVRFHTRFIKSTMFKKFIQKSAQTELVSWYKGYANMLRTSVQETNATLNSGKQKEEVVSPKPEITSDTVDQSSIPLKNTNVSIVLVVICLFFITLVGTVSFLIVYIKALHDDMELLQKEIAQLRAEQIESLAELRDTIISNKFSTCAT